MTTLSPAAPSLPLWLKAVAALGALWYAFGLLQFALAFTMDIPAAMAAGAITEAHGAHLAATPGLVWAAYALASAAGLIGAGLLFVGHPAARAAFAVSLVSAGAYYLWVYAISGTGGARPSEEAVIGIVVIAVTAGFLALANSRAKG